MGDKGLVEWEIIGTRPKAQGFVCSLFLLILIKFFHKVWLTPIYIQYVMRSQGVKGPSYEFFHGNNKEMINLKKISMIRPMDLSHDIFSRIQPHMYSWIKQYGKHFLFWNGPQAQLVVTEPELIKEILSNKNGAFPKVKLQSHAKKLIGDGLVVTEGKKWSKLRKLANHAFHAESLKEMVPTMIASVEAMLEGWRHNVGKETEVYEAFSVLTSEVISKTAFGSSYLEGKSIFEMLEKLGIVLFRNDGKVRFPIPEKLYKTADDIESDELEQSLRNSIIAIVNKREEKIKNGEANSYGNDFLGSLINIYRDKDENNRISLDDLIDECKTFYLAGHETTSSSLTWVILLLAIHTDWQQKAREEVLELFGKETPNPEGIAKLKIVNMIICETLRLYPPVTTLPRTVKSKVRLGKLVLPPNIEIFIPPLALHLNPEIWGRDAHLFKPERFLEGWLKQQITT
ncbi:unnamed protein product [Ilex paraguariensis]|uniref:Cytochrome P450 n=1 Tax=Ilex paraguariensis TaxID=185542 RepID=A0ABC8UYR9_9AQUA